MTAKFFKIIVIIILFSGTGNASGDLIASKNLKILSSTPTRRSYIYAPPYASSIQWYLAGLALSELLLAAMRVFRRTLPTIQSTVCCWLSCQHWRRFSHVPSRARIHIPGAFCFVAFSSFEIELPIPWFPWTSFNHHPNLAQLATFRPT